MLVPPARAQVITHSLPRRACHARAVHAQVRHVQAATATRAQRVDRVDRALAQPEARVALQPVEHAQAPHAQATTHSLRSRVQDVQADAQSALTVRVRVTQTLRTPSTQLTLMLVRAVHAQEAHVQAVHVRAVHVQTLA